MKINEALKDERIRLGLTQAKFAKGIFTASNYSKIELGQQGIDSDDLFKLLAANKINFEDFALKIREEYVVGIEKENPKYALRDELMKVFYEHDLEKIESLNKSIQLADVSEELKIRSILIEHILKETVDQIDAETKLKIKKLLFVENNWVTNDKLLRLFANSMVAFDEDELDFYFYQVMDYYLRNRIKSVTREERVSVICINYVYNSFTENLKYVSEALELLENMRVMPELFMYKITARYFDNLFNNKNKTENQNIREIFSKYGFAELVKRLPEEK